MPPAPPVPPVPPFPPVPPDPPSAVMVWATRGQAHPVLRRLGQSLPRGAPTYLDGLADLAGEPMVLLHNGIHRVAGPDTMVVSVSATTPVIIRWRVSEVPPM